MREIKIEVLWLRHKKDFTTEILKHYTTIDRLCNGLDKFDYKMVDVIAKRQYTGLKDANGVEIYEGDILKWEDEKVSEDTKLSVVCSYAAGGRLCQFHLDDGSLIVIGNIHENPELLK